MMYFILGAVILAALMFNPLMTTFALGMIGFIYLCLTLIY